MSTAELASSYAALILADDGVEITVSFFRIATFPVDPASRPAHGRTIGIHGAGTRNGGMGTDRNQEGGLANVHWVI